MEVVHTGKKFRLAIITSQGHPALVRLAERKLTDCFDYDIIDTMDAVKKLPSPTPYSGCYLMTMGSPLDFPIAREILETLIEKSPVLKWVHIMTAGVEYLLTEPLKAANKHITFTNSRGAYNRPLAEFVLMSILYFAKKMPEFMRQKATHKYEKRTVNLAYGAHVGIVGFGSIGRTVSKLLKDALNAKIYAVTADPVSEEERKTLEFVGQIKDLPSILPKLDYLVTILPLTPATHHLIKTEHFKMMKPSAVFINIGRGPTVEEAGLIEALKSGTIAGAGLDVFEVEPLPPTSPLYELDNVLMTPHSTDIVDNMTELSLDAFERELRCFVKGKPFVGLVNLSAGY
ncbi:MAG: D-2-hydroxyacid dehydrogenase [Candidatus Pacebacteria bacterium]|nr:D-2-hydroxyacid dehydrogenase [Candidatus Paceibacterota bacterium]